MEDLTSAAMLALQRNWAHLKVENHYGRIALDEAIKRMKDLPALGMTPQQFIAKQQADLRDFYRSRTSQGLVTQRVSQQDHNYIVAEILQSVAGGVKPSVRQLLETYCSAHSRPHKWVERVAAHTHSKKMGNTLLVNKTHPVLKELKDGGMLTQSHKSALQNSTYSGFTELLFTSLAAIRSQRQMRQQLVAVQAELVALKSDAASLNARLDLKEDGRNWREAARTIRAAEPQIKNTELACRVGVSESAIRKYITSGEPLP